jgi:hypothetical protein
MDIEMSNLYSETPWVDEMGRQIRARHSSAHTYSPSPADFDAQLFQTKAFPYVSSLSQNPYFGLLYRLPSKICRCYLFYTFPKVTNSWREFDAPLYRNKAFTDISSSP